MPRQHRTVPITQDNILSDGSLNDVFSYISPLERSFGCFCLRCGATSGILLPSPFGVLRSVYLGLKGLLHFLMLGRLAAHLLHRRIGERDLEAVHTGELGDFKPELVCAFHDEGLAPRTAWTLVRAQPAPRRSWLSAPERGSSGRSPCRRRWCCTSSFRLSGPWV